MHLKELVKKNRSYRRFFEEERISIEILEEMLDNARLGNSAGNKQPLKYIISNKREINEEIFKTLSWAAYLQDWKGPVAGERPAAYIVILGDSKISKNYLSDPGIASAYILLTAVEHGLGGCIIATIDKKALREILNIKEEYEILYVIALGKPREKVVLEELKENDDIKYYRDSDQVHHVPKRSLKEIIVGKYLEE
ncbi:MAG TPA: nitroreductase [Halanaerobiaceae bacterium]|jgi:nitroreductase|nr:nitroreductase family protein [Bacillota bacterium]HHU92794.1 nitroreductase [Halanaerobiaceae bacterium]HOA41727.1 nitroreductase family protein [Halanaerobiales bacterium]HPZ63842.1 nitroreductase family protein [Halanaerobiales bacterium]HQD05023.1 nitroreductase family protein [Halanaerobiales bacterium]